MQRLLLFLHFFLFCAVAAADGVEERHLYEAEVAVADQGTEAREAALPKALAEVLVKVTGYGGVADDSVVADMLANAGRYVQQYRYRHLPAPRTEMLPQERLFLWVQFDAAGVNRALRERGQPVWGSFRPLVLLWLAVESEEGRHLLGSSDAGPLREAVDVASRRRALPLRLPLLDLAEQAQVRVADVWGGFHEPLLEVSERYQPQAVLIGRLYRDGDRRWVGRWMLHFGEDLVRWEAEGESRAEAIRSGVDGAADALALHFAQIAVEGAEERLRLRISGVKAFADYNRLLGHLRAQGGVMQVIPERVDGEKVVVRLVLNVAAASVERSLNLGGVLEVVPAADGAQQDIRNYRLQR